MSELPVDVRVAVESFWHLRTLSWENAYVPARLCRSKTIRTHSALKHLLSRHPGKIRSRRAGPRLWLEVNALDFLAYLREQGDAPDPMDGRDKEGDALMARWEEIERIKAQIRDENDAQKTPLS